MVAVVGLLVSLLLPGIARARDARTGTADLVIVPGRLPDRRDGVVVHQDRHVGAEAHGHHAGVEAGHAGAKDRDASAAHARYAGQQQALAAAVGEIGRAHV